MLRFNNLRVKKKKERKNNLGIISKIEKCQNDFILTQQSSKWVQNNNNNNNMKRIDIKRQ